MQPIETIYHGYKFRSRLEARWAVFFDSMGIEWEYEREGFVLDDGSKYLPDFWLPESKCWAEVKPEKFTAEENRKCELLSKNAPVILLAGLPEPKSYTKLIYIPPKPQGLDDLAEESWDIVTNEYIYLFYHDDIPGDWEFTGEPDDVLFSNYELYIACNKAKQARFEHG